VGERCANMPRNPGGRLKSARWPGLVGAGTCSSPGGHMLKSAHTGALAAAQRHSETGESDENWHTQGGAAVAGCGSAG